MDRKINDIQRDEATGRKRRVKMRNGNGVEEMEYWNIGRSRGHTNARIEDEYTNGRKEKKMR